ncbi:MAG: M48 family metallopeptidase [Pirellulales bacterium]
MMWDHFSAGIRRVCEYAVLLQLVCVSARSVGAQDAQRLPPNGRVFFQFGNGADFNPAEVPAELIDEIFGEENEADRAAIAQVKISPREERQLGSAIFNGCVAQLERQGIAVEKRGQDVAYVQRLVDQLRPLMANDRRYRQIQVHIADTDDTEALSFPGGAIIVSRGLIEFCESEAALVAVLGHELSHIDRGHQLYHLRRWKLMQKSLTGRFDMRQMMHSGGILVRMVMQPFRPEEELQADGDGVRWAFELGYDPAELAQVLMRFHQRQRQQPNFVPAFLRSHPSPVDRYQAILKQADELADSRPHVEPYVGRENLRRRIPRPDQAFE